MPRNGSMFFTGRSDRPSGKLGLKMKTAILPNPVPPEATAVEAEVFTYFQNIREDDLNSI